LVVTHDRDAAVVADEPLHRTPDEVTVALTDVASVMFELERILQALSDRGTPDIANAVDAVIGRMPDGFGRCSASSTRRMGTMAEMPETVSVAEAAERLRIRGERAYMLVFSRQLRSVEAPSGRRLVPVDAIDEWRRAHPVSA
jgi:hypothetical protein